MNTPMKLTFALALFLFGAAPLAMAQAKPEEVTLTGTLRGDRIAAGGDSTGWALQYKDKDGDHTVEVQLPAALATRSRTPEVVTLTGTFGTREYVERGTVRIFRVTKIAKPPASAPQK